MLEKANAVKLKDSNVVAAARSSSMKEVRAECGPSSDFSSFHTSNHARSTAPLQEDRTASMDKVMSAEDTVFTVLSFVPADALLRFKDPAFGRFHAARAAPLHGFFAPATLPGVQRQRRRARGRRRIWTSDNDARAWKKAYLACLARHRGAYHEFMPVRGKGATPPSVTRVLARQFVAADCTRGLVLFSLGKADRSLVFLVDNPATCQWVLVPTLDPWPYLPGTVWRTSLVYGPAASGHFKIVLAGTRELMQSGRVDSWCFHVFSSETFAWKTLPDVSRYDESDPTTRFITTCNVGGGSVAWKFDAGDDDRVMLYNVASGALQEVALPPMPAPIPSRFPDGTPSIWGFLSVDGCLQ